jgi:malonate decarboxylase delta subunit
MEQLQFEFKGKKVAGASEHSLAGVVSSGNLEVLIEKTDLGGGMRVVVNTAAVGFGETWRAVLADFSARHPLADVLVTINDAGATPAVVSLRLDQAVEEFEGDAA